MILFRADLSPQSGLARLRRAAELASLLRSRDEVLVACREDKRAAKFLAGRKVPFSLVKDPAAVDLAGTAALVFDLPSLSGQDAALLEKAGQAGVRTVWVAPAGAEPGAADLIVSPLAAPEQALLHHKFRHFHRARRRYRRAVRLVFVRLGDMLAYRDLRRVVDVLHRLRLHVRVEAGLNVKKADRRNLMRIYPGVHFRGKSESPARAYFEADLALIPAGEEALEAACVGTPALYVPGNGEQEALADSFAARGIGARGPSLADFSLASVREALSPLEKGIREEMGAAGRALVDGLGVQRFFKALKDIGIID